MFDIFQSAGWPIWLLLITSIIGLTLIIERFYALQKKRILPDHLLERTIKRVRNHQMDEAAINQLAENSPLGLILATGLRHANQPKETIREHMEETGHLIDLRLGKFLTTLGTIATLAPLLGLFGTVIGMIEIFGAQNHNGMNPTQLAHGISVALYNTGFGLMIAMPALVFYRHFKALINNYLIQMENQAAQLLDTIIDLRRSK